MRVTSFQQRLVDYFIVLVGLSIVLENLHTTTSLLVGAGTDIVIERAVSIKEPTFSLIELSKEVSRFTELHGIF